jgi:hypothetical protein
MDDAGRLVLVEHLQQLRPSVGFECLPRVVGKTKWVAQPGRIADLDQHMGELGTARDLPKPTVRVDACARVPSQVGADLPTHDAKPRNVRLHELRELSCVQSTGSPDSRPPPSAPVAKDPVTSEVIGDPPVAAQVPAWPRARRREW